MGEQHFAPLVHDLPRLDLGLAVEPPCVLAGVAQDVEEETDRCGELIGFECRACAYSLNSMRATTANTAVRPPPHTASATTLALTPRVLRPVGIKPEGPPTPLGLAAIDPDFESALRREERRAV